MTLAGFGRAIERLFEKHKLVRRLLVFWSVALITWGVLKVFSDLTLVTVAAIKRTPYFAFDIKSKTISRFFLQIDTPSIFSDQLQTLSQVNLISYSKMRL